MTTIPLTLALATDILSDIEAGLGVVIPEDNNFLRVYAQTQAAQIKLLYLTLASVQKNVFPDTADSETFGGTLERAGRIFLGRNPFPATPGQYVCVVSGSIGGVIPASTTFRADDDSLSPGVLYILDTAYTLSATTGTITLRALPLIDQVGKLDVLDTLTCTRPLINVNGGVVVQSEAVAPIAAEEIEAYRKKVLEKIRIVAGSWSAADYRLVGGQISGVGQIYAYARSGFANEANVFVEGTIEGVAAGAGVVADVETATELVRPMGIFDVHYAASTINLIRVTITEPVPGVITVAQQALILSGLRGDINQIRPFIAACDVEADKNDYLDIAKLYQLVLNSVGSIAISSITFTIDGGAPASSYTADQGRIPYLHSITYA